MDLVFCCSLMVEAVESSSASTSRPDMLAEEGNGQAIKL